MEIMPALPRKKLSIQEEMENVRARIYRGRFGL